MDRIKITAVTEEDLAMIAGIEMLTYTTPWAEQSFREIMDLDYYVFMKAEEEGQIVGYCAFQQSFDMAYITNVTVRSDYRGNGIGRKMLMELMRFGTQRGVKRFTLEVRCSNRAAIALYTGAGFLEEGVRKNFYESPREDALVMWLRIGKDISGTDGVKGVSGTEDR